MAKINPRNALAILDLAALLVQRAMQAIAIGDDITDEEVATYRAGDDDARARLQAKIDAARQRRAPDG